MRTMLVAAALCVAILPASPAAARWKLIEQGEEVKVAKSDLRVTPAERWNRWTSRPIKGSEVWTLDGVNLNEVYFVAELESGETLFRDANKRERPLPQFDAASMLTDIPDFFESSTRLVLNTSVFEMTSVEPATLAGHDAIRFRYEYSVANSPLLRKGMAVGSIVNGQLNLISFNAPAVYFFDRDLPKFEQIVESATF